MTVRSPRPGRSAAPCLLGRQPSPVVRHDVSRSIVGLLYALVTYRPRCRGYCAHACQLHFGSAVLMPQGHRRLTHEQIVSIARRVRFERTVVSPGVIAREFGKYSAPFACPTTPPPNVVIKPPAGIEPATRRVQSDRSSC